MPKIKRIYLNLSRYLASSRSRIKGEQTCCIDSANVDLKAVLWLEYAKIICFEDA